MVKRVKWMQIVTANHAKVVNVVMHYLEKIVKHVVLMVHAKNVLRARLEQRVKQVSALEFKRGFQIKAVLHLKM